MVTTHNFENYTTEELDNGDLVVRDPNGTIVKRWSVADGEWVFPAVSVEEIGIDGVQAGTSKTLINADETDGDNQGQQNIQYTFDVGTSATTIFAPTESFFFVGGRITVVIRVGVNTYALDEVLMLSDGSASATSSIERNSPPSRTYTIANSTEVQLELASDTANIVAFGELLDINSP